MWGGRGRVGRRTRREGKEEGRNTAWIRQEHGLNVIILEASSLSMTGKEPRCRAKEERKGRGRTKKGPVHLPALVKARPDATLPWQ